MSCREGNEVNERGKGTYSRKKEQCLQRHRNRKTGAAVSQVDILTVLWTLVLSNEVPSYFLVSLSNPNPVPVFETIVHPPFRASLYQLVVLEGLVSRDIFVPVCYPDKQYALFQNPCQSTVSQQFHIPNLQLIANYFVFFI